MQRIDRTIRRMTSSRIILFIIIYFSIRLLSETHFFSTFYHLNQIKCSKCMSLQKYTTIISQLTFNFFSILMKDTLQKSQQKSSSSVSNSDSSKSQSSKTSNNNGGAQELTAEQKIKKSNELILRLKQQDTVKKNILESEKVNFKNEQSLSISADQKEKTLKSQKDTHERFKTQFKRGRGRPPKSKIQPALQMIPKTNLEGTEENKQLSRRRKKNNSDEDETYQLSKYQVNKLGISSKKQHSKEVEQKQFASKKSKNMNEMNNEKYEIDDTNKQHNQSTINQLAVQRSNASDQICPRCQSSFNQQQIIKQKGLLSFQSKVIVESIFCGSTFVKQLPYPRLRYVDYSDLQEEKKDSCSRIYRKQYSESSEQIQYVTRRKKSKYMIKPMKYRKVLKDDSESEEQSNKKKQDKEPSPGRVENQKQQQKVKYMQSGVQVK